MQEVCVSLVQLVFVAAVLPEVTQRSREAPSRTHPSQGLASVTTRVGQGSYRDPEAALPVSAQSPWAHSPPRPRRQPSSTGERGHWQMRRSVSVSAAPSETFVSILIEILLGFNSKTLM